MSKMREKDYSKRVDLLLVNTPNIRGENEMRLGLLTIASYIRKNGFNCLILSGDEKEIKRQIEQMDLNNTIVGFTATTDVILVAYALCRFVKNLYPKALCVVGGSHPTALPKETLQESDFDMVVYGEGELTMLDIIKRYKEGGSLKNIPGTVIKLNDEIIFAPPRDLIEDLDVLGQPAFDLVRGGKSFGIAKSDLLKYKRVKRILVTRGCPFNCAFCASKLIWRRRLRWHSIDYILEQINFLIKTHNIDALGFFDDELICNKAKITELCEAFIKTGLVKKIKWECQGRVDRVEEEILLKMKEAGCRLMRFGIESGSPRSVAFLKQNTVKVEDSLRAIALCNKVDMLSFGSFIIGSPEEDLSDILQTIDFIENSGLSCAEVFIATPYPGTDLYAICREKGYLAENINWNDFLFKGGTKPLIRNKHFSGEQLKNICDYINLNVLYYLNQGRSIPKLDHRKEIEKILNGDLSPLRRGTKFKLKEHLRLGLKRPEKSYHLYLNVPVDF